MLTEVSLQSPMPNLFTRFCTRAFSLQLLQLLQVSGRQVDVDVMVKERPMRTADLECEWQVAPGDKGRPSLVSIVPGGSLTFEHRNIAREGRQVCCILTLSLT